MRISRKPGRKVGGASMKVPPKRKGNFGKKPTKAPPLGLNESPSEKEGK